MKPERWEAVERLYNAVLELEPGRREAFLNESCAGDESLRKEVVSLLACQPEAEGLLESPALEAAAKGLAQNEMATPSIDMTGLTIAHYRVLKKLGQGGMGVVYKARDLHLGRFVALKVLPPEYVADPDRKRRFVQEARAASALNHPNIVTIHDITREGGTDYIVMEYVEGKTLDQRIGHRGMHLHDALNYAVQIANALAKAHAAGIIHRDLKPTNIMVTEDGVAKILDFGLAKLTEQMLGNDSAPTAIADAEGKSLTDEGIIIGTVSYMSPEQAEGKRVDARSDIFSFGAVLYEMVSGQKAFEGDTKMSTLAAILKQEPKPISQRVPGTPAELEKIINRCLLKALNRRFQTVADFNVALEELKEESDSGRLAGKPTMLRSIRRAWIWAGAALIVVAIAYAGWFFSRGPRKPGAAPEVVPLTSYPGFELRPSFSPDGNQVVFSWNGEKQDNYDIYIKLIGAPKPLRLTSDPADDKSPAFSPDGRSIGFIRVSKQRLTLILIPAIGGSERIVADSISGDPREPKFSWFPDGKWVVTGGLSLISTESGETRSLTRLPPKSRADEFPGVSPDGRTVAFSRFNDRGCRDLYLLDLSEDLKPIGEPRRLTSLKGDSVGAAWTPDGREVIFTYLVYGGRDASLWRIPASGATEPEQLPLNTGIAFAPAISRNGNRLAYQQFRNDVNIWRLPLSGPGVAGGPPTRFNSSTRWDLGAQYSPDGKRVAFASDRSGTSCIWVCDADGSNAVDLQTGAISGSPAWSPDGQRIALYSEAEVNSDIYVMQVSGGKPIRLTTHAAGDVPSWSREGKWIYFGSERTGRYEVWKVSAGGGEAVQLTRNGGSLPLESRDGKFIYYKKGPILWKMPVSVGEESQVLPSMIYAYCPVNEGIYFIPKEGADRKYFIQFLSFATGKVKTVAPTSTQGPGTLSVSPDGRFILYSQIDDLEWDLMLVENFR